MNAQLFAITIAPFDGWFLKWSWVVASPSGLTRFDQGRARTEAKARACAERAVDARVAVRARENQRYAYLYPAADHE